MIWFLMVSVALWSFGALMKAPRSVRWAMIALLYGAIALALFVLPAGNPLAATIGVAPGEWLLLGGFAAIVLSYRQGLTWLKSRARPAHASAQTGTFSTTELDRYARHIMLREVGGPGQKKLKNARVLVVGAGGLGAPALQYLAAAGVGTIGVIDDDVVDNSNLQRQVIHTDARIGMPKVFSAEVAMLAQNPHITVRPYHRRLNESCAEILDDYDIVLDGCDNFDTRYLVNRLTVAAGKPLIAAALTQWEGQISLYDAAAGTPCYQCVFPKAPSADLVPSCAEAGVIGPLPGVIGAMMALEAVKAITGAGETLRSRLMIYDALYADTRIINAKPRTDCPVCGG
jgi:molybdopterin-synthase adenylyltransferase